MDDSTGYGYGGAGPKIINGNVYIKAANLTELNAFNVSTYAIGQGQVVQHIWNTDTITYGWLNISANNLNVSIALLQQIKHGADYSHHMDIDTIYCINDNNNIFDMMKPTQALIYHRYKFEYKYYDTT